MKNQRKSWYTALALILIIVLVVPILAACDDDDDDDTTQPGSSESATTPADTSPIKIGIITDYSGPGAIAGSLTDQTLKAMDQYIEEEFGGSLLGREVKWEKFDCKSQVSLTVAGVQKLALDDDVALILTQATDIIASTAQDECEKLKVPYLNGTQAPKDMSSYHYAVRTTISNDSFPFVTDFIIDYLKPEKIALLGNQNTDNIEGLDDREAALEAAGIDVVYREHIGLDVRDLSPYLTQIKRAEPDVFDYYLGSAEQPYAIVDQITGLGGWGDIKVIDSTGGGAAANTAKAPGGAGTYHWTNWAAGLDYPGAKQFERIWNETFGTGPNPYNFWAWICVTTGLNIIDQAGTTDHDALADFMHSGKLSYDGLIGPYTIGTDGITNMLGIIVQVQDEQFVPVYTPDGPVM